PADVSILPARKQKMAGIPAIFQRSPSSSAYPLATPMARPGAFRKKFFPPFQNRVAKLTTSSCGSWILPSLPQEHVLALFHRLGKLVPLRQTCPRIRQPALLHHPQRRDVLRHGLR